MFHPRNQAFPRRWCSQADPGRGRVLAVWLSWAVPLCVWDSPSVECGSDRILRPLPSRLRFSVVSTPFPAMTFRTASHSSPERNRGDYSIRRPSQGWSWDSLVSFLHGRSSLLPNIEDQALEIRADIQARQAAPGPEAPSERPVASLETAGAFRR